MATDRVRRQEGLDPEEPLAVVGEARNALRLQVLDRAAAALGLEAGMPLADARAAVPNLLTRMEDPARQERLLAALHRWAHRFSPFIAIEAPDALVLDISGCAHLFGGEAAMLERIRLEAEGLGFESAMALADTRGAARALCRFAGQDRLIAPPGEALALVSRLPVSALGAEGRQLRRLGLKTLGDVARLPATDLTRRFGASLTRRLEEALGRIAVPVAPVAMARRYSARLSFPEPIGLAADVTAGLERLHRVVLGKLEADSRGAIALELVVQRSDHSSESRRIGLARPCAKVDMVMRQWAPVIDRLDAGFGIDVLRLIARGHAPLDVRQGGIAEQVTKGSLEDLIGTLGNRLGFDRITCPQPTESHLPGFNETRVPAVARPEPKPWPSPSSPRPLRLFPGQRLEPLAPGRPPRRFRWRGRPYELACAHGPKRILPEWWQEDPRRRQARDYWRVETQSGERLWLGADPDPGTERSWSVYGELP